MNYEDRVTKSYLEGLIPRIVSGSYAGDGAETRTISLGFTPKAVFVCNSMGVSYSSGYFQGGLAVTGHPVGDSSRAVLSVVAGGFAVCYAENGAAHYHTNRVNSVYHYLAIG